MIKTEKALLINLLSKSVAFADETGTFGLEDHNITMKQLRNLFNISNEEIIKIVDTQDPNLAGELYLLDKELENLGEA